MGTSSLDKQNLQDLAAGLKAITSFSDTFFDNVRKTLSDISEKVQTDNCGTIKAKEPYLENSLAGLVQSSSMPDITETLGSAINEITKRL
jgi:hypothetical protein